MPVPATFAASTSPSPAKVPAVIFTVTLASVGLPPSVTVRAGERATAPPFCVKDAVAAASITGPTTTGTFARLVGSSPPELAPLTESSDDPAAAPLVPQGRGGPLEPLPSNSPRLRWTAKFGGSRPPEAAPATASSDVPAAVPSVTHSPAEPALSLALNRTSLPKATRFLGPDGTSVISDVPAAVPSVTHRPCCPVGSLASHKTRLPSATNPNGKIPIRLPPATEISEVPAPLPSVTHRPILPLASTAWNAAPLPKTVKPLGANDAGPATESSDGPPPVLVITHQA